MGKTRANILGKKFRKYKLSKNGRHFIINGLGTKFELLRVSLIK